LLELLSPPVLNISVAIFHPNTVQGVPRVPEPQKIGLLSRWYIAITLCDRGVIEHLSSLRSTLCPGIVTISANPHTGFKA
jgi:hypothetical protein